MVVSSTPKKPSPTGPIVAAATGNRAKRLEKNRADLWLLSTSLFLSRSTTSAKAVLLGHGPGESSDIILEESILALKLVVVLLNLIDLLG